VYDGSTVDVTFVQQWVRWVKETETREGDFLTNCGVWIISPGDNSEL
jgi:hypothetical protein